MHEYALTALSTLKLTNGNFAGAPSKGIFENKAIAQHCELLSLLCEKCTSSLTSPANQYREDTGDRAKSCSFSSDKD